MPRIISIDDLSTDTDSGYSAVFDASYSQPTLVASTVTRDGDSPLATNVTIGAYRPSVFTVMFDDPALRGPLLRALDTSGGAKAVTIADDDGGNPRYLMLVVEKVDQYPNGAGYMFAVTTVAAEDVRWRDAEEQTVNWTANSSGAWTEIDNDGDLDAYPVWKITPRGVKSPAPNFKYSRAVIARWRSLQPTAGLYPINITGDAGLNTAALVTAGKVVDSSDICVMVDGVIWPHWFGAAEGVAKGFNTTNTYIWINLNFPRTAAVVADETVTDEATELYFRPYASSPYVSTMPASGRVYVPDTGEIFYYGGVDPIGYFYDIQRGVAGTTAAEIPSSTHLEYLPHEIYILYGPGMVIPDTLKRYNYDDAILNHKPLIVNPNSTNAVWEYTTFRDGGRTAEWRFVGGRDGNQFTQETDATGVVGDFVEPWTAMGFRSNHASTGKYENFFPAPIQSIYFTVRRIANGLQSQYPGSPVLRVLSSDNQTIYRPFFAAAGASTTTNSAVSLTADFHSNYTLPTVNLHRIQWMVETNTYVQADLQYMRVTFYSARTPLVTMGAETSDYDLAMQLQNYTTGESLFLYLPNMELDKSLIIDSYLQTAVYNGDGSNQYAAVRRNAPRAKFLRLIPGINNIRVYETGLTDVDIDVTYRRRFYT